MTTVFQLGKTSLPSGATVIPQTAVPANVTSATLTLTRCTTATPDVWASISTTLALALEASYDGGVTFLPGGGMTAEGGVALRRGAESPSTVGIFSYGAPPTHIQGTVTVANGPLVTTVTLAVS